jgi:hypothetical protein
VSTLSATDSFMVQVLPTMTGGVVAVITFVVMRLRQDKRNRATIEEFYKRIVPEDEWPEYMKPKDPEMEEIKRLRAELEAEQ